jgi:hypothetical protein
MAMKSYTFARAQSSVVRRQVAARYIPLVNGCAERSYIHRPLTPESQSRRKAEIGLSGGGYDRVDQETLGFL